MNTRKTRVSLIFPYIGDDDEVRDKLIQIIEAILNPAKNLHTCNMNPIMVVNQDSNYRGMYEKFTNYLRTRGKGHLLNGIDITPVWAVDTCQMWLAGFGKIIDDKRNNKDDDTTCILQIPGDLKDVKDFGYFLNQLSLLRGGIETNWDFAIGDFEVEPEKAKHLIDMFGTYPLIFNWFPDVAKKLQNMEIKRPRSEFLAARLEFLETMLPFKRKFAYEETLALLIQALSYLFSWDNVPGTDTEKLKKCLRDNFDIEWAENAKIRKSGDNMTINIFTNKNSAKIKYVNKKKAILEISGGRIHELKVEKDSGKLNIYMEWKIGKVDIGVIHDFGQSRGFREANDQIERMERLLKLLWREMNGGDNFDVNEFERLDRRSTAIREAAIVSLGNFLR